MAQYAIIRNGINAFSQLLPHTASRVYPPWQNICPQKLKPMIYRL